MQREFDYVIVGAGAAGCVLAARLSEDPSVRVALLEAGPADRSPLLRIPGANVVTGADPRLQWNYQGEAEQYLDGRTLPWAQGKVLGGSSSINGMMVLRGHHRDYDGWRAAGCVGWGADDVLPYFRKAETNERGAGPLHGGHGPLHVSRGRSTAPICEIFLQGAAQAGHVLVDDLSAAPEAGFGHIDMSIRDGVRSSTSSAYLRPVRRRANLTVMTGALATRVLVEHGRATGVEYLADGQRHVTRACKEVILAGGAVNSPQLLMLSGIGPADELSALGLRVLVDAPEVGRNLQNHPSYRLMYTCAKPVTAYRYVRPWRALGVGVEYLLARRGPLSRGLFPTAGFIRSDETGTVDGPPDIQVCMAPALIIRRGPGVMGVLPQRHGFTLLINQGTPYSRGEIRLRSADPTVAPRIDGRYFSDPRDLGVVVRGIQKVRNMMRAPALSACIEGEIQPRGPIGGIADLEADIRATCGSHYHPAGTCRMGADERAVLDPELRVRGIEGLRVIDASVMPTLVGASTFATTVMIAEKGADLITRGMPAHIAN